jgi:hypothetical protein
MRALNPRIALCLVLLLVAAGTVGSAATARAAPGVTRSAPAAPPMAVFVEVHPNFRFEETEEERGYDGSSTTDRSGTGVNLFPLLIIALVILVIFGLARST